MSITVTITDDFCPARIAGSGQCFRWQETEKNTWRIITGKHCVYLSGQGGHRYCLDCDEHMYHSVWEPYFDLHCCYQSIRERISPSDDPFLWTAMEQEKVIRILQQDPWETLITFIISQNRNIPAIRRSVELLSAMCGERCCDSRGIAYHAFPSPEQTAALGETQLIECRLGYRWKYVHAAADAVVQGKICLDRIRQMNCEETICELMSIYGVGRKVASCIALFGFHQLDAFPRDVWMNRVLANEYPDGYPSDRYRPYNGVYQQYMFAYYRNRPGMNAG